MTRKMVSLLVFLALMASAALAAEKMTVYIGNKPFKGKTLFRAGRLYLPLQAFATALDLKAAQEGKSWCLNDNAHADAKCADPAGGLCVNGMAIAGGVVESDGTTWIAVQPTMKALGGVYLENKTLGMIDIRQKYVAPPEAALKPQPGDSTVSAGSKPIMVHWSATW